MNQEFLFSADGLPALVGLAKNAVRKLRWVRPVSKLRIDTMRKGKDNASLLDMHSLTQVE